MGPISSVNQSSAFASAHTNEAAEAFNDTVDTWASTASGSQQDIQDVADQLKQAYQTTWKMALSLDNRGLTSLPPVLKQLTHIETLNISNNHLTRLPELPPNLRRLMANNNQLTELPDLPVTLVKLTVDENQLVALPPLPAALEYLNAGQNSLTRLPDLPDSLIGLSAFENQLSELPRLPANLDWMSLWQNRLNCLPALPDTLTSIDVSDNLISHIDRLPDQLKQLKLGNNQLDSLPTLPDTLEDLDISGNQFSVVPSSSLPRNLRRLAAGFNNLQDLPEGITSLPDTLNASFLSNPFPHERVENIRRITQAAGYQGPSISVSSSLPFTSVPTLGQAAAAWYSEGSKAKHVENTWNQFKDEEGATEFAEFLNKLTRDEIQDSKYSEQENIQFKRRIARWLTILSTNTLLRSKTFAISVSATETCADGRLTGLNQMEMVRHIDDIEQGKYDQRIPELVSLMRGLFRLERVDAVAKEKSKQERENDPKFEEDTEVLLAYQNGLRDRLDLALMSVRAHYSGIAGIYEAELNQAEQEIKQQETKELLTYLNTHDVWAALLQRKFPEEYEQAQAKILEEYPKKLQQTIEEKQLLANDVEIERVIGVPVLKDVKNICFAPLTQKIRQENPSIDLVLAGQSLTDKTTNEHIELSQPVSNRQDLYGLLASKQPYGQVVMLPEKAATGEQLFAYQGIVFRGVSKLPEAIKQENGFHSKKALSDPEHLLEAQGLSAGKGATGLAGVSTAKELAYVLPYCTGASTDGDGYIYIIDTRRLPKEETAYDMAAITIHNKHKETDETGGEVNITRVPNSAIVGWIKVEDASAINADMFYQELAVDQVFFNDAYGNTEA